jgi:hypothetical protein
VLHAALTDTTELKHAALERCDLRRRVEGSGYRVEWLGLRVEGSGIRLQASGLRVESL